MNRSFSLLLICLAFSCSESEDLSPCVQAEFVTNETCSRFVVVDVKDNPKIGVPLDYAGKHYPNAIKVFGDSVFQGSHYYRIRKFEGQKDARYEETFTICPAIYVYDPFPVPEYVIEAEYSNSCR